MGLSLSLNGESHAPQIEGAFGGISRVGLGTEKDEIVGQERDRHVGKNDGVRAVGELLVIHVLVVQVALFFPMLSLCRLEVHPALNRFGFKIRVAVGVDIPHAKNVIERMRLTLRQPIAQTRAHRLYRAPVPVGPNL